MSEEDLQIMLVAKKIQNVQFIVWTQSYIIILIVLCIGSEMTTEQDRKCEQICPFIRF